MPATLKKQTIFITGATSGFGHAMAVLFAKEGARVIVTGRREDRLKALKKTLGKNVHVLALDVRDAKAVKKAVAGLPKDFRDIDVLVNNAGLALGLQMAPDASLDNWEQMVDTNIKGVLYCTRAILPGMVKRNSGHIVNIGSIAGSYPYPGGNTYGATKAFVRQFSLNLRADLLGKDIRVTNVEPGIAETEFSIVRFSGDKGKARKIYENTRALSAEDVADAVLWCISRPLHVNVNAIEIMAIDQAFSPFAIHRKA